MYALAMTQHNLRPSEHLAYDPHTANTIHPGHWSMAAQWIRFGGYKILPAEMMVEVLEAAVKKSTVKRGLP